MLDNSNRLCTKLRRLENAAMICFIISKLAETVGFRFCDLDQLRKDLGVSGGRNSTIRCEKVKGQMGFGRHCTLEWSRLRRSR